jgi:hypothetical protein
VAEHWTRQHDLAARLEGNGLLRQEPWLLAESAALPEPARRFRR